MDIEERRTAEQAQTKVESSQHFPIRVTGTALVNAFYNSKQNGGVDNPTVASVSNGAAVGGATWRQSVLGIEYRGPETLWGGKIHGSLTATLVIERGSSSDSGRNWGASVRLN